MEGQLPSCQDTGTAIVVAKKGENVYTGVDDGEWLSKEFTIPTKIKSSLLANCSDFDV